MPNDHRACRVVCPFFRQYEGKHMIECEGVIPGTVTESRFRREELRTKWAEVYCETYAYIRCDVARALDRKESPEE